MHDFDLVVLGAGPGGYVAAIRAAQLGLKTAIVEKESLGGVCLNWGCIPTKALIHQAGIFSSARDLEAMGLVVDRGGFDYSRIHKKSRNAVTRLTRGVEFLLKKNGVETVWGRGVLAGKQEVLVDGKMKIGAKNILIATGSRPGGVPGFELDEAEILTSRGVLSLDSLPESMLVLGAGAVGVEFSYLFNAFGVEVHLAEMLERILPAEDEEISEGIRRTFSKSGIRIHTSIKAEEPVRSGGKLTVALKSPAGDSTVTVDKVLVAVGRKPNTEDMGLEEVGVRTEKGFVQVDEYGRTDVSNIYAVGDVVPTPLLAHVASREGRIAVEHMAGRHPEPFPDPGLIPRVVYCEPQAAGFGLTEKEASDADLHFEKAAFPYRGTGKAVAVENQEGFVKLIYEAGTKKILGAHIAGGNATELIHELLLAKSAGLSLSDIVRTIHAHPTLAEAILEAAEIAEEGRSIHS